MPVVEIPSDTPDEFKFVQPGMYVLRCVDAPAMVMASTGNGYNFKIRFAVQSGPNGEETPDDGRTINDSIFQNEGGQITLKKACKAFGVDLTEDGENLVFDSDDFIEKLGLVKVSPNTYTDKVSGQVKNNSKIGEYLVRSS